MNKMLDLLKKGFDLSRNINLTIKGYILTGMIWALLATILGLVNELQLMALLPLPDLLDYGHLRPVYTLLLIFGSLLSFFFAGSYWILQKETGAILLAPAGWVGFKLHQTALIVGVVFILLDANKGREYGELFWIADNLMALALVLFLVTSVTAIKMAGKSGVVLTSIVVTAAGALVIYLVGNVNLPYSALGSVSPARGMQDAALQEAYRTGVLVYFILMPAFTLLYFFIPAYYKVGIFSESLFRFQVLAIIVLVPLAAGAGLVYSAAPEGLQTLGIVAGMALAVAIMAGGLNLHYSLTRSGKRFQSDALGLLIRFSLFFLIVASVLRIVLAPRFVQAALGFTWLNPRDIAFDAQTYVLMIMLAGGLYMFQKINEHTLSARNLKLIAGLAIAGIALMFVANIGHGAIQAVERSATASNGDLAVQEWSKIVYAGSFAQQEH
ncbi:MAG: cbb3-type cytochrome c oxidase subunit I, partial [Leptospiraceae bacterium]|nr:cbb3-type cytochrome c oxidase subunit I [Leptospiraceae bacterium]